MIDTIKLVKVLMRPLPYKSVKWQSFKTNENGVTIGVINPTAEDRRNGMYMPDITYYERPMPGGGHRYEVAIETSLPKLHFGNNFEELTEPDYKAVVKDLKRVLRSLGFSHAFVADISNFEVRKVDFCKNVRFTDGTTVATVISNLAKADISKVYDVQKTDFRNGGKILHIHTNSQDIAFYDKISDLEQARKSERRAKDETPSYCQFDLLKTFEEERKQHPLSVLRYEIRLNSKTKVRDALNAAGVNTPLTFKNIFRQEVSKTILLQNLDKIINKIPNSELLDNTPENLLIDILAEGKSKGPRDVFARLGFTLVADSISDLRKFRTLVDENFHKDAWGRLARDYLTKPSKSQLKALLKLREEVDMG